MSTLPPRTPITCDRSSTTWPSRADAQCNLQTGVNFQSINWNFAPAALVQICETQTCMAVVNAIRAANPTECTMDQTGKQLYSAFLSQLDSACQTTTMPVASPSPPPAKPTNIPPTPTPPPPPTMKKPQVTETLEPESGEVSSAPRIPDATTSSPTPSVSGPLVATGGPGRRTNTTTTPAPTETHVLVADPDNSTSVPPTLPPTSTEGVHPPSTNTGTSSPSTDGSMTTGSTTSVSSSLPAVVVGLVVGLLVMVTLLLWIRRRRNRAKAMSKDNTETNTLVSPVFDEFHSLEPEAIAFTKLLQPLVDWRVDATAITDGSLLGTGSHGAVYLVKVHKKRLLVAKRVLANTMSSKRLHAMVEEIHLISSLQHPRIVSFVGVAWTTGYDLQVLFEYMEQGDLRSYLDRTEREPWTLQKVEIALQIVEALTFVHSFNPPIVHRDLKARNILLGNTMNAKISDFGVARIQSEDGTMTTGIGTSRWLAPEVIRGGGIYTEQCDIYSFGVVLVEMDTHAVPFAEVGGSMSEVMMLMRVADGDLRPELTEGCDPRIAEIVSQCLDVSPSKRPNALELAFRLRQVVKPLKNP